MPRVLLALICFGLPEVAIVHADDNRVRGAHPAAIRAMSPRTVKAAPAVPAPVIFGNAALRGQVECLGAGAAPPGAADLVNDPTSDADAREASPLDPHASSSAPSMPESEAGGRLWSSVCGGA
jgi:hypothetical protein